MKRNVSVVRFKFRCNNLISIKIIKEMSGSVASGTPVQAIVLSFTRKESRMVHKRKDTKNEHEDKNQTSQELRNEM